MPTEPTAPENPPEHPEIVEPTDAEIADAAAREARDLAARNRAAKKPAASTAPRGRGRPPGAKNKPKGESEARTRASSSTTTTTKPKALPSSSSAATDADREARKAAREARTRRVNELTAQLREQRPGFVMGVGTLTGLPVQYLVQPRMHEGQPVIDSETQQPIPELTVYGAQLAPKDWQIRTGVEAYVRIEETELGERMADAVDKWAPYLLMVGAVGAVGVYAFTTLQISQALKPMIAEEIRQAAMQQQAAQQSGGEGGSPTG